MKFTIISHACLYIEHENTRLLIDPWILGSCYWRSWWNYPEPDESLIKNIEPTHIYITHLHWDHFHGPSLRRFEKCDPEILLPKHFNKRMKGDFIRDFRFKKIKELDHGKKCKINEDFFVTSYQFNPIIIDSSLVIEGNNTTLLNVNDSKTFGQSMKQILCNHPKIDFAFRSHSSATAIPHCIKGSNVESSDRSPLDYADDFIAFAKSSKSRYIVPFASSHVYLHPLSIKFNKFYSNPAFIKNEFDKKINSKQKCVLMPSNSSWSENEGFKINKFDFSKISFEFPILHSGLKSKLTYSELEFEIGKELRTSPVSLGEASTSGISFSYPIKHTANDSIFLKTEFERKEIYNETSGSVTNDKVIENFNIGLTFEKRDVFLNGDISLFSIDKSFGDLDLSKVSVDFNNDQASSGPKRHGSFDKTLINFYYSQWINENLNFKTSGLAQFSNKNLDSSEQLSLGGITGVRAYPSGEASGDQGYKLTAELQTNLSKFLNNDVSANLFYDYGRIQQYKDPSNITLTTPNKYSLSGWGVAFDFNPNRDFSLSLVFSKTLGSNDGKSNTGMNSDGRDDDSRAWLLLSYNF